VLALQLHRRPTHAELAVEMGITEERVREIARMPADPLSLSQPLNDDGDAVLGDMVEDRGAATPFDEAATALLPREVEKMLAGLSERERRILHLRFGLDRGEARTLEEVGEHFGLTRERIRQIEARAMSKLRHPTYAADVGALLGA
jgi:DNA-directed RNA polymerase sigma subunit (sigma70/sigma32)